ncbi:MAG: hypothetical protein RLZZ245_3226, partial [Verrucomicrobiota bacterium]
MSGSAVKKCPEILSLVISGLQKIRTLFRTLFRTCPGKGGDGGQLTPRRIRKMQTTSKSTHPLAIRRGKITRP